MTQDLTSEATVGLDAAPMLTSLKALTGVSSIVSAAHRSRDGAMHGHTWEVIAWWEGSPCAVEKKAKLAKYLSIFDHTVLGDDVAWGEALGKAIVLGLGCAKVEVRRPLEGIFASVEKVI
jgi:hypothetical protein